MLSAEEANKKTLNTIKECITTQLLEIEKEIDNAISNGEFFCIV